MVTVRLSKVSSCVLKRGTHSETFEVVSRRFVKTAGPTSREDLTHNLLTYPSELALLCHLKHRKNCETALGKQRLGCFCLVLVGFGWFWLVLVGFSWFWLVLVLTPFDYNL